MNKLKGSVHVNQIGENWEVESEAGTLGQAETKREAEEMAVTLARQMGAKKVEIHTADGQVEWEIAVPSAESPEA
ncbi:MAG: DUF2188 domain-containing protein [Chthoniobacteraceae bacterium]